MAAARALIQTRFASLTRCPNRTHFSMLKGLAPALRVSKDARGLHKSASGTDKDAVDQKPSSDESEPSSNLVGALNQISRESDVNFTAFSNLKSSTRHDLAMIFTCKVCETRSVKTVCRESYEKGVVMVRCGGCNNLHLIADRLGWFGEPGSVEDLLAARGEEVRKGSIDTLNLTLEDLVGSKST